MPISTIGSNSLNQTSDLTINGQTVGKGGGNVATNTVHGASALAVNTSGSNNVAVGYQAAYANTEGTQLTAVGYLAVASNTTGYYATGIGAYALNSNTTGDYNTAVGRMALRLNTTGANGTALGYQALYNNTTGSSNTGVGNQALLTNSTGTNNTALGMNSLYFNTGSYNTSVGRSALESNTTASNNTAVGYQAGYAITTQSNNIYIGYSCGSSQTGSGGIFIGANAFSGYNGNNQVAFKTGDGREALYADINAGASFRQYSNSSTWATTSDQRVKENIVEITDGLEKIIALRPVTFDYITSKEHNAGFIAQDFQTVLPDQVKKVKARPEEAKLVGEDEIYSIQQNLVPYLVNAIKDLKALVDAQAAEIAELKAKVA